MDTGKFLRSFTYALRGIKTAFREEFNIRVHLLAAIVVVVMGLTFKVSWLEWIILVLVIGSVFAMELLNSSIEGLADLYSKKPEG